MKYIDADRLRAEIEKRKSVFSKEKEKGASKTDKLSLGGRIAMLEEILVLIGSLRQEQPDVDFDEEIDTYFYPKNFKRVNDGVEFPGWHVSDWKNPNVGKKLFTDDLRRFARHFYELGKSRKEE